MSLETLDRRTPSFVRTGPSALAQAVLYSTLALFLMVSDARFQFTEPLRQGLATALYPLQWLMLQPVAVVNESSRYFQELHSAQQETDTARRSMVQLAQRASQAEQLLEENARLRGLLDLRARLETPSQAAQILYNTADPYTRRVVIDQGRLNGIVVGSPVVDEAGVLGQVTRVQPYQSEVTLLTDRDQAIPVLSLRAGTRGVAYGDPVANHGGGMELRFMPASADLAEGDLLTTSGLDGVYPPGLPVARVLHVERRTDSAFARIYCKPLAQMERARHVLVLRPVAEPPPGAELEAETAAAETQAEAETAAPTRPAAGTGPAARARSRAAAQEPTLTPTPAPAPAGTAATPAGRKAPQPAAPVAPAAAAAPAVPASPAAVPAGRTR